MVVFAGSTGFDEVVDNVVDQSPHELSYELVSDVELVLLVVVEALLADDEECGIQAEVVV